MLISTVTLWEYARTKIASSGALCCLNSLEGEGTVALLDEFDRRYGPAATDELWDLIRRRKKGPTALAGPGAPLVPPAPMERIQQKVG